jgi:SAM-dependent methyltransferase
MSDPQAVRAEWSDTDYPTLALRLQPAADALLTALAPIAGADLLDVATGTGNVALAAARAGASPVVGVDLTPELLEVGRAVAAREHLDVDFVVGDAEALAFEEDRFDVVTSTFGVIFAPRASVAAGELARVLTPGGRLGLTTWSAESVAAGMATAIGRCVRRARSPLLTESPWAGEQGLHELFAPRGIELSIRREVLYWHFPDAETTAAFALDRIAGMRAARRVAEPGEADALRAALTELVAERGSATAEGFSTPLEYLLVTGVKTGA